MSDGDDPDASKLTDLCAEISLQDQSPEAKQPPAGPTAAQGQAAPEKKEQSRRGNGQQPQQRRQVHRSEEKVHQQRQCRNGAMCGVPNCDFLHPQPGGWVSSPPIDYIRFTDGRAAPQNVHAPINYHYSVEEPQYSIYGGAVPNAYAYHQPVQSYERSVRVMQAYPPQYNSYDAQMGYDRQVAYDNQPQQPWAPQYDYNPTYFDPNASYNDVERRAEQIGQGEGFGDSCPCCSGNPENCQAQQCAERGFCGCLFGAMDADVVDDTWRDEWFAASRTCVCCEGYIYRCKVQDDACTSGTCFCSHTKGIEIPGT